ncbi:unnamed protein product [Darwinula stevensoni]|uniref:Uncharacterized protein n=1 Tax=Darwinula stevensoni TaxID=69355 RepID=A0A7R9A739_9CRUS|nr:unnamed protein product [Darwinula stevensoni]CAG0890130.1 unnamed protein product [Darwinula stevensoni]
MYRQSGMTRVLRLVFVFLCLRHASASTALPLEEMLISLKADILEASVDAIREFQRDSSDTSHVYHSVVASTMDKPREDIARADAEQAIETELEFEEFVAGRDVTLEDGATVGGVDVSEEVVTTDNHHEVQGHLDFKDNVTVWSLYASTVQGVDMDDLARQAVTVDGEVLIRAGKRVRGTLAVDGGISLDGRFCGKDVDAFFRVASTDSPVRLGNVTVVGSVKLKENLKTGLLNNLPYPIEAIDRLDRKTPWRLKGVEGTLTVAGPVEVDGLVQGLSLPTDVVPLNGPVLVPAPKTFYGTVKFLDKLYLNGTLNNMWPDSVLSTPSEPRNAFKNVIFKGKVHVRGTIRTPKIFDLEFYELINDIIMREEIESSGTLVFESPKILDELRATAAFTKNRNDTESVLYLVSRKKNATIKGKKYFSLGGFKDAMTASVNGFQLKDLADCLSSKRDQVIPQRFQLPRASFETLDIRGTVNLDDLADLRSETDTAELAIFQEKVKVEELVIRGGLDIRGNRLSGTGWNRFLEHRASLSRPQELWGDYEVDAVATDAMTVREVNEVDFEKFLGAVVGRDEKEVTIRSPKRMEAIYAKDVECLKGINGQKLSELGNRAVWLAKDNYLVGDWTFDEELEVEHFEALGELQGLNVADMADDIIYPNEDAAIPAVKIFIHGMSVQGNLNASRINEKPMADVLTKSGDQNITGFVEFKDVMVRKSMEVEGKLGRVEVEELAALARELQRGVFSLSRVHGGDIVFEHPVHISGNLNVTGSVNSHHLKPLLKSAVRVDRPTEITAVKKFTGKVNSLKDIKAGKVEGEVFREVARDLVLKRGHHVVPGRKVFPSLSVKGVLVEEQLVVRGRVDGTRLEEVLADALRLNRSEESPGWTFF